VLLAVLWVVGSAEGVALYAGDTMQLDDVPVSEGALKQFAQALKPFEDAAKSALDDAASMSKAGEAVETFTLGEQGAGDALRIEELRSNLGVEKSAQPNTREGAKLASKLHSQNLLSKTMKDVHMLEANAQRVLNTQGQKDRETLETALESEKKEESKWMDDHQQALKDVRPTLEKYEEALTQMESSANSELSTDKSEIKAAANLAKAAEAPGLVGALEGKHVPMSELLKDAASIALRSEDSAKEILSQTEATLGAVSRGSHWDAHVTDKPHLGEALVPGEKVQQRAAFAGRMKKQVADTIQRELKHRAAGDAASISRQIEEHRLNAIGTIEEKLKQAGELEKQAGATLQHDKDNADWIKTAQEMVLKEAADVEEALRK